MVEISVQDTGIGMSREQQGRIFDAFVQAEASTSANYGGTGLGLAICRDYCELMGGSIQVQERTRQGIDLYCSAPFWPRVRSRRRLSASSRFSRSSFSVRVFDCQLVDIALQLKQVQQRLSHQPRVVVNLEFLGILFPQHA